MSQNTSSSFFTDSKSSVVNSLTFEKEDIHMKSPGPNDFSDFSGIRANHSHSRLNVQTIFPVERSIFFSPFQNETQ